MSQRKSGEVCWETLLGWILQGFCWPIPALQNNQAICVEFSMYVEPWLCDWIHYCRDPGHSRSNQSAQNTFMAEAIEKTVITLDDANPRPLQDSTVPLSSPTPTISVTDISAPACLQSAPPPESQHIWIKPFQCSHNSNYLETISGALTEAGYCVLDEAEKSNADCWLIIQCSAQGPSPKAVGNLVLQGKELGRTVIIAGCDQSREQGDKDAASKLDPGPSLVEKISGGVVTQLLHKKASPKVDTCQVRHHTRIIIINTHISLFVFDLTIDWLSK